MESKVVVDKKEMSRRARRDKRKILVADDHHFNQVMIMQAFGQLKIALEVVCVEDGQAAIDKIKKSDKKTFVLIMLDFSMPLKNGL